jgi:hypothetical protein
MSNFNSKLDQFLGKKIEEAQIGEEVCDIKTGVCYVKTKDGLIERTLIEKKLMMEDGRELLREESPISHSRKTYLR